MTTHPKVLEAATKGMLVPIVGAGVSMSLSTNEGNRAYPSWHEVLEDAAATLQTNGKLHEATAIRGLLLIGRFQTAADIAKNGFVGSEWGDFLTKHFDIKVASLDVNSMELPKALWSISRNIITLNFDKVLRYTCPDPAVIDFDNAQAAQLANFIKNTDDKNYLWHLHGRIDNLSSLVFTSEGYGNLYNTSTSFQAALTSLATVCASRTLLFVGCSLSDAELLSELSLTGKLFEGHIGPHFALAHKSQADDVRRKLKDLPFEVISFTDFGQPLLELIQSFQVKKGIPGIPSTTTPPAPREKQARAAIFVADPIDKRYCNDNLLKELRKLKCEIHYFPLNIAQLNSITGFDYVFLLSTLHRGKMVIEDQWIGSHRVDIDDVFDNMSFEGVSGFFVFLDSVEIDQLVIKRCSRSSAPIAIFSEIEKKQQASFLFKIFKKKDLNITHDAIILNHDRFQLDRMGLTSNEYRIRSPLSETIDPRTVRNLVGRVDDLKNLCKRVLEIQETGDVLTVKGAGGIGKTMLAKASAIEFSTRGLFSEGIFFIDCEFISDFHSFEQQLGRAFDFQQYDDLRKVLTEHRSHSDRLVILDNAESLLLLQDTLEVKSLLEFCAGYCTIIVTSRELLRLDSEIVFEIRQLTSDEALALFKRELGGVEYTIDDEIFIRERIIEELLDNNPLAIKLITRNIPKGKDFHILHEELTTDVFGKIRDEDVSLFSGDADRNVERKRSIYASINYSYTRLSEKEKAAFEVLSLFPAGINMESFKKVCDHVKTSKKRDSKSENNPANQFIITDAVIKSLESKSIIEIDNNIVCLQSLVGRFADHQFKKRSAAEIRRLRKNAFSYLSSFSEVLTSLMQEDPLIATKIYWNYQKNFIKAIYYSNAVDADPDEICTFLLDISFLCTSICSYGTLLAAFDKTKFNFEQGSIHERCVRLISLKQNYYNGDFGQSSKALREEFPMSHLTTLDPGLSFNRRIVAAALNIFIMEGNNLEILPILPTYVRHYEGYPDILFNVGEFDKDIIEHSKQGFFTFEAKLAIGSLQLGQLDSYISTLHKQEHLERMQTNYVRVKAQGAPLTDIQRLVVVNPYSSGIKSLMLAMTSLVHDEIIQHYEDAITKLFSIKYYHVEAHLYFARHLYSSGHNERFAEIKTLGIKLAKEHGYRYLQFLFEKIDDSIWEPYTSSNYPLPKDAQEGMLKITQQQRLRLKLSKAVT
jgi:hypothetical protein